MTSTVLFILRIAGKCKEILFHIANQKLLKGAAPLHSPGQKSVSAGHTQQAAPDFNCPVSPLGAERRAAERVETNFYRDRSGCSQTTVYGQGNPGIWRLAFRFLPGSDPCQRSSVQRNHRSRLYTRIWRNRLRLSRRWAKVGLSNCSLVVFLQVFVTGITNLDTFLGLFLDLYWSETNCPSGLDDNSSRNVASSKAI
jgi:hypothetical protein